MLKPSPSTVNCQSAVTLTVVSLTPQLHCPRIWSVTPATVGFGATDIFETFTDRCQSVFNDTDSGVVAHTILLSGYQDSVAGSENRPYKESGKFNDC